MCGLAGFISKNAGFDFSMILDSMLMRIAHRGKENRGVFIDSTHERHVVAIGHNRLSIIDTNSRANQPYRYDNLVIAFNGEIYNYKELTPILVSKGYYLDTTSDTEVIVKLFHCFGAESIELLNGMFAISIYDIVKQKIFLIRDRMGVKPLVYYYDNNSLLFSSEIKSFFKNPLIEGGLAVNPALLARYFKYGYVNSFDSVFHQVAKVENGQIVTLELETFSIQKSYYWQLNDPSRSANSINTIEKAEEAIEPLLKSSVNYRFVADVGVGIFLSSGIDSNLVMNIALDNGVNSINSFTYKNAAKNFNEETIPYDDRVTQYDVAFSESELWQDFKFLCANYDEPFSDPATLGLYSLSKFAKDYNKVILVGDGGDELLGGYQFYETIYYATRKNSKWANIPLPYFLIAPIADIIFNKKFHSKYLDRLSIYHAFLRGKSIKDVIIFTENRYDTFSKQLTGHTGGDDYRNFDLENDFLSFLNYKTSTELVHQLNYKTDIAGMLNTIEIREPFLDFRLFELQQRFSEKIFLDKDNGINNKFLLRNMLDNYDNRFNGIKKAGFKVDLESLFKQNLIELDSLIVNYKSGFVDEDYVKFLWKGYLGGKVNFMIINRLISFILWDEDLKYKI
ncbi:asparagine synthase (glutamine-hydrolyzing) [Daejeonella sp.]|uniref:asparagine synthase (glutamine-hydrolyzing) n=1 Tax=Daejeonella sp. TaxID=2805397 RepID=UPI0030BADB8B